MLSQIEIEKARQFLTEVSQLASKYELHIFAVTRGVSITVDSNSCETVQNARENHIEWKLKQGYDPFETWN